MSVVSDAVRARVADRAGDRCEYCRLPAQGQVSQFPVDHVRPRAAGGATRFENLALACPHCNAYKWAYVRAIDPETGAEVPLFDPRTQPWFEHFRFMEPASSLVEGTSPCGRATVDRLRMNHPNIVAARVLLIALGRFP